MSPTLAADSRHATTRVMCAAVGCLLLAVVGLDAQSPSLAVVKARFVINLATFTEWPNDTVAAGAPLELCVLDDTGVVEALEQLANGQVVGGHTLTTRRVTPASAMRSCNLLYVSGIDVTHVARLLSMVKELPVLTVGDSQQFVHLGGVASLFADNEKMRFAVNVASVRRSQLRLSSKLLTLAKIVNDGADAQHH